MSAMRRPLAGALLAAVVVALTASPAAAHAQLSSTEPVGGTAGDAPERVVLRFTEPVTMPTGAVRLYDSDAERITTEAARHPDGDSKAVAVRLPELDRGLYVVTWRVTSADSHPVHGAFTFRVGPAPAGAEDQALARRLLAADGGSAAVGAIYAVIRFVAYASLIVLVGALAFLAVLWPAGVTVSRMRRLVGGALIAAFVSTAAGIPVQAAHAAGLHPAGMFSGSVLSDAVGSRFGQVWAVRLVLLAVLAAVVAAAGRKARAGTGAWPRPLVLAGGVLAAGILLTPGLAGHAATRNLVPLAVASNLVHLAAISVWLGGLVALVAGVLPRRRADELAAVVPRFSRLAGMAVAVIVVTGLFQTWREVGSTVALTTTTYGRLLTVKVLLFAGLVALGALSRKWVHARYRVPAMRLSPGPGAAAVDLDSETVARLRRTVGAETLIAVVVVAVTALLVSAEPARSAVARPFSTELVTDQLLIDVTVDPAKAGPADLHFYTLDPAGAAKDVQELEVRLRLEERDVGPLDVPVEHVAPGHFAAYGFEFPLRGEWQIEAAAQLSEIDQVRAVATIPIR